MGADACASHRVFPCFFSLISSINLAKEDRSTPIQNVWHAARGTYMKPEKKELDILRKTTLLCLAFGVAGIVAAALSRSQSMLFDGLYSFIQSFFIMASASIVKLISRGDDDDFHFGYGSFEPFLIFLRTLFMLGMNAILLYRAAQSLFTGGYTIEVSLGIIFTAFSAVVCFFVWRHLVIAARELHSAVLKAEARSWLNDTLISCAVLAAFLVMGILDTMGSTMLVPYIDPLMTVLFIAALSPPLIQQLTGSARELLNGAPPAKVQKKVEDIIQPFIASNHFIGSDMYASKRGRSIYMVIYVFLRHDEPIASLDAIRQEMIKTIRKTYVWSDIDIVFTLNPQLVELSSPDMPLASV